MWGGFVKRFRGKARVVRQAHHERKIACPELVEGRNVRNAAYELFAESQERRYRAWRLSGRRKSVRSFLS
ncbi:MAG: hypothetical protein COX51_05335, partial [Syntrophobacteraceae bacterium CG23_combo_of_CG06-09_8_20_14_all_50_8]